MHSDKIVKSGQIMPDILPGFADSSQNSQQVFRQILSAMSEPGTIVSVHNQNPAAPNGLTDPAYSVALTLFDDQTRVGLSQELQTEASVRDTLVFHCGCELIDMSVESEADNDSEVLDNEHGAFDFIIVNAGEWSQYKTNKRISIGNQSYPDQSTTVVMQLMDIQAYSPTEYLLPRTDTKMLRLTGPGIEAEQFVAVTGLPSGFAQDLQDNQGLFPLGLDFILVCSDALFALPRTCSVEVIPCM